MGPTYEYRKVVTIGDTNAMQNLYFAEYFKLQGIVRELWVKDKVRNGPQHLAEGLILSTKSAHCEYKRPFYLFDTIVCRLHFEDLRRVSVRLVFDFYHENSMQLNASGWQVVVFKDRDRKTCRAPDDFVNAVKGILWDDSGTGTPSGKYEERTV